MTKKPLIAVALLCSQIVWAHENSVPPHQTLEMAVQHAMVANPDLLLNRAKALATEQGVKKAEGAQYPSIDVTSGIGREQTNNPITNSIGGASSNEPMTRKEFGCSSFATTKYRVNSFQKSCNFAIFPAVCEKSSSLQSHHLI